MSFIKKLLSLAKAGGGRDSGESSAGVVSYDSRPAGGYVPFGLVFAGATPIYAIPLNFYYELAYNNDIVRTSIRALIQETFRKGIRVVKRYELKCANCGTEFHRHVAICPVCGSKTFVEPNEANRVFLERVIEDANRNNEALVDVLQAIDWDINVVDNAFLVVIKNYYYDEDGRLIGAEPVEIVRADPRGMRLVMNKEGRMGVINPGKFAFFCPAHRETLVEVGREEVEELSEKGDMPRCPKCNRQMLPAYYSFVKAGGETIYYAEGEVLHVKKFTYGLGYGYPPLATVWMKAMILMRQDYFILMGYHLMRSPRGILFFKGVSPEQIQQAWMKMMEVARVNPHMLTPLVLPADADVQYIDMGFELRDIDFGEYREELRRAITALYGVMPIFLGESRGAGRDVMQILVTNRAVEMEQRLFNDKVLPWLSRQLGVDDWVFELAPSELRDERAFIEIQQAKLDMIERLKSMGYDVEVEFTERGEVEFKILGKKDEAEPPPRIPVLRRPMRRLPSIWEGFSGAPEGAGEHPRYEGGGQRVSGEPGLPPESRTNEII
jgi:Zn finger protein HypA/HybF involved in hydrogenase expression